QSSDSDEVKEYIEKARNRSKDDIDKEKTGVFTGLYALNPVTGKEIPVWVSDYVLAGYGTGAIMAVPFADERDKEFAKKFDLPIIKTSFKAQPKGEIKTHYHLRDWLISRQRYWGAPIPMVFCQKDGWQPVPEAELPVMLPYIENFRPLGTGASPLAQDKDFVNTTCPVCGGKAERETDVADTFLDSSWYFLRYPVSDFKYIPIASKAFLEESRISNIKSQISNKEIGNLKLEIENSAKRVKWLPVNSYIGGAEHSVLHLLYSRFITKVLFDLKLLDFDEPFTKFRAHGLIIKDGAKMSKSRGNVVNPDEYIAKYGADTLRCYLMFLGPFDQGGDFRDSGIEGMERFLKRVRTLVEQAHLASQNQSKDSSAKNLNIKKSVARAVMGVGSDIENLRYNTAIAKIMELVNDLKKSKDNIESEDLKTLTILLAPFAPYLAEELWEMLHARGPATRFPPESAHSRLTDSALSGNPSTPVTPRAIPHLSVHLQPWPEYDRKMIEDEEANIAVQVNGKLRSVLSIEYSVLSNQSKIEEKARQDPKVSSYLEGKEIRKVIYVKDKILNFVV
ncbi:MAG: class I tRNA ligase family protein, partial [Patescibacteria group bacterium]